MSENVFRIKKPIKHGDTEITEIAFREPTMKDIRMLGLPFNAGTQDVNMPVVAKYLETLAALPPSVVNQLSAADVTAWVGVLIPFFGDADAA